MILHGCRYDELEPETLSRAAFDSLPEYSCSVPTGVFPGKVWKCNLSAFTPRQQAKPLWIIREYVATDADHCRMEARRPVIADPGARK